MVINDGDTQWYTRCMDQHTYNHIASLVIVELDLFIERNLEVPYSGFDPGTLGLTRLISIDLTIRFDIQRN